MRIGWKHVFVLILLVGAVKLGIAIEADHVQRSCEDPDSSTLINGVQYTCLTPAQAARIRRALAEHGA